MGWRQKSENVFEKTVIKERDPTLGLVTVSDDPKVAFRATIALEASGKSTLVRVVPEVVFYGAYTPNPHSLRPRSSDYNQVLAFVEAAIAQAQFETGKAPL